MTSLIDASLNINKLLSIHTHNLCSNHNPILNPNPDSNADHDPNPYPYHNRIYSRSGSSATRSTKKEKASCTGDRTTSFQSGRGGILVS